VLDLYVSDATYEGGSLSGKKGTVKRYDGATGAFIDTFVPERSGGLKRPSMITFTQTDPVTLEYRGGDRLTAASLPAQAPGQLLGAETVQPLLTEALTRWQAAGMEVSMISEVYRFSLDWLAAEAVLESRRLRHEG
jgi:hypothetical protein